MTVGTKTVDLSSPYKAGWIGRKVTKTWSGSDDPVAKRAFNPYSATIASSAHAPVRVKNTSTGEIMDVASSQWAPYASLPSVSQLANVELAALNNLLSKIRRHNFNVAVTVGEGRTTLNMMRESVMRLYRSSLLLKHGKLKQSWRQLGSNENFPREAKPFKSFANNWLAFRYGWTPLLSDIYNLAEAFNQITAPQETVIKAKAKQVFPAAKYANGGFLQTGENVAAVGFTARLEEISDEVRATKFMGLTDPATLAWELLPFSFVVDWFIPIGQYIEVRNQLSAVSGEFCRTKFRKSFAWCDYQVNGLDPRFSKIGGGIAGVELISLTREALTSLSVPLPRLRTFRDVYLDGPAQRNVFRLLDSVTLLSQVFGSQQPSSDRLTRAPGVSRLKKRPSRAPLTAKNTWVL